MARPSLHGDRFRRISLVLGSLLCLLPGTALAQLDDPDPTPEERTRQFDLLAQEVTLLEKQGNILKRAVKLVRPSVVHIEAVKSELPIARTGRRRAVEEAGSGVIIEMNQKFYVLTNRHVIKSAELEKIKIKLADGRQLTPTQVWTDAGTDIGVMAISAPRLVPARTGDSDVVDIGDFVLAAGSPFGLSQSISFGIISAKGRRDLELGEGETVRFQDFMQTDAAINPGNSGGPLLNLRGEVIGINTAIASSSGGNEGIGFTIPVNMVMVVAKQLVERGAVTRAFLGVALDRSFDSTEAAKAGLPRPRGTRITSITPNSPAEAAKLQKGDIILEFNGVRIDNDGHLINLVSLTEVGKTVPVTIYRDKQLLKMNVKVGKNAEGK